MLRASDVPPIVVASNRGPVSFRKEKDHSLVPVRGGGGLVTSLAPAVQGLGVTWFATAVSEEDREAAARGAVEAQGIRLHHIPIEWPVYRQYYDVIANGTLWFLHHNLFDLPRRPFIDSHWWDAWHSYCDVNTAYAQAIAEEAPTGAVVLVHDYHLSLVGKWLKEQRPDLKTMHFHHTPFAARHSIEVLPTAVAHTLLDGLASNDACGFHSETWSSSFEMGCRDLLGRRPRTFVSAAAPDVSDLQQVADTDVCRNALHVLEESVGDRKLIVRVDRIELSKNLLRGFLAYEDLLREFPQWRERVTFAAFVYPSRETMAEYLAYRNEVEGLVARINEEWSTHDWQPILLQTEDDFPRSLAALLRYDVLLVNPIRDGLNLVAKEGALMNHRDGVVVLSRQAGSWNELSGAAIGINPYDIIETRDALLHALNISEEERTARAESLRTAASARQPQDWLIDQLRAVGVDI